jgi:archaeal flagellar protein FlaG
MSAETFTTAMFLITAVIAAGVLINAVYPVVYNMASTFSSATHESDQRLRTDFKIVTTLAQAGSGRIDVWVKNIGTTRIPMSEIAKSDVFCGAEGDFDRVAYVSSGATTGQWTAEFASSASYDINSNQLWDPGETLHIIAFSSKLPTTSGDSVYFQFILPDGIWRTVTFNAG